jgi:hypothetical protein
MYNCIYKLARLFNKYATPRTLYHGTSIWNASKIKEEGLIPQVGHWVSDSYGSYMNLDSDSEEYENMYNKPIFDLVFAADKDSISSAVGGMQAAIAKELKKPFYKVSDDEIKNFGALIVVKEAYGEDANTDWKHSQIDNSTINPEIYPTVEPGDYFSENEVYKNILVLTGNPMIRVLRQNGAWPSSKYRVLGPDKEMLIKQFKQEGFTTEDAIRKAEETLNERNR